MRKIHIDILQTNKAVTRAQNCCEKFGLLRFLKTPKDQILEYFHAIL